MGKKGPFTGQVLSDYRLGDILDGGGFGAVYLAQHVRIPTMRAAVKILHEEHAANEGIKRRFMDEAMAASVANHENIVQIFNVGETPDGSCYLVMELLEGESLKRIIEQAPGGCLGVERSTRIALQVARALDSAHRKGIVHRDLKPANIFVLQRGERPDFVKVLDFGIARMRLDADGPAVTRPGAVLGTFEYMSMEQMRGLSDIDGRTDIHALGVILHLALVGRLPRVAKTFEQWAFVHMTMTRPKLTGPAEIPEALRDLVTRMIASDRRERPSSMAEVIAALEACSGRALPPAQVPTLRAAALSAPPSAPLSVPLPAQHSPPPFHPSTPVEVTFDGDPAPADVSETTVVDESAAALAMGAGDYQPIKTLALEPADILAVAPLNPVMKASTPAAAGSAQPAWQQPPPPQQPPTIITPPAGRAVTMPPVRPVISPPPMQAVTLDSSSPRIPLPPPPPPARSPRRVAVIVGVAALLAVVAAGLVIALDGSGSGSASTERPPGEAKTTNGGGAVAEREHQLDLNLYQQAVEADDLDGAVRHFQKLPPGSAQQAAAQKSWPEVKRRYIENHLTTARSLQETRKCDLAVKHLESVLYLDEGNEEAQQIARLCQSGAVEPKGHPVVPRPQAPVPAAPPVAEPAAPRSELVNPFDTKEPGASAGDESTALLRDARTDYLHGHYAAARSKATEANRLAGGTSVGAWRLIGGASCKLNDERGAAAAWNKLGSTERQFLKWECQKVGITLP